MRLTALTTRSGPTISIAKLCRVGLSTALTVPRTKTSAKTIQGATAPLTVTAKQAERGKRHQRLGDHQQAPLREAVGEQPAPGAEEQDRQELQRRGQPDRDAAAGQLEDQPDLGDHLHPVAGERDDLPGEVAPVVGDGEGVEGCA